MKKYRICVFSIQQSQNFHKATVPNPRMHHSEQKYTRTIECRYNAVWYSIILHTVLQQPRQKINQNLHSQQAPYISPVRARYGVSVVRNLGKTDRVITAPHCISFEWCLVGHGTDASWDLWELLWGKGLIWLNFSILYWLEKLHYHKLPEILDHSKLLERLGCH